MLQFPRDKHTLGVLQDMRRAAMDAFKNRKNKKKKKDSEETEEKE